MSPGLPGEGSVGEVEARLRVLLGLSGYEARVYLAVLRLGRAQPREIALEAGVPQQRVYDVLRSLERRGLVAGEGGYYRALPPEEALAAIGERRILEAQKWAEELKSLARRLSGLAGSGGESVALIHGLEQALSWAVVLASSCGERPVFAAYKAAERLGDLWPLLRGLLDKLPRGALVLVPRGSRIPGEALEYARSRGVEVREAPCLMLDLMVACDSVILGLPGPGGDVVAVVVRSGEFAGALRERLLSQARC